MPQGSEITVVVMEQGAAWPSCIEACRRVTPDTVVIAQNDDESSLELARRVRLRLAGLEREGRPVRAGVLAVSRRGDEPVLEARSRLAKSLLVALSTSPLGGSLHFAASSRVPGEVRHHLIALAGTLTSYVGSSQVAIAIRFSERSHEANANAEVRALRRDSASEPLASAS